MTRPGLPEHRWGQLNKTAVGLINDHSFSSREPERVLLAAGATGEISNVAIHTEASVPIYIAGFSEQLLIGCLEEINVL
ncbi:nitrogen fixation protein NifZ [Bradyrhizobium liaoningense]|nr:nitrogen fixation protein NifZ [Bradyrhizobium liaoningense]